jgi:hypothetical protein
MLLQMSLRSQLRPELVVIRRRSITRREVVDEVFAQHFLRVMGE